MKYKFLRRPISRQETGVTLVDNFTCKICVPYHRHVNANFTKKKKEKKRKKK